MATFPGMAPGMAGAPDPKRMRTMPPPPPGAPQGADGWPVGGWNGGGGAKGSGWKGGYKGGKGKGKFGKGMPFGAPPPPGLGGLGVGTMPGLGGLAPPTGPPRAVSLAQALSGIQVTSSKVLDPKAIAVEFVKASKERQTELLRDPTVARAILQTLSDSSGSAAAPNAGMGSVLADNASAAEKALEGVPSPAWTGTVTLARNTAKRLPTRASLLHGRVEDVEVALRSAAAHHNVFDITHRVQFDEVSRKIAGSTVLALMAGSQMDLLPLDEYCKYFRSKMRAGVVRLTDELSMYVLPPAEDVPALRDTLYALGAHVPRMGCLIAVIAQGASVPAAAPAQVKTKSSKSEPAPAPAAAPGGGEAAAKADEDKEAADTAGLGVTSTELLDLFSNPELIKLLNDDGEGSKGS